MNKGEALWNVSRRIIELTVIAVMNLARAREFVVNVSAFIFVCASFLHAVFRQMQRGPMIDLLNTFRDWLKPEKFRNHFFNRIPVTYEYLLNLTNNCGL